MAKNIVLPSLVDRIELAFRRGPKTFAEFVGSTGAEPSLLRYTLGVMRRCNGLEERGEQFGFFERRPKGKR